MKSGAALSQSSKHLYFKMGPGVAFNGTVFAWHLQGIGFDPKHCLTALHAPLNKKGKQV